MKFVQLRGFSLVSFQLNFSFNFGASSVSLSCERLMAKGVPRMERMHRAAVLISFNLPNPLWVIRGKTISLQAWTGPEGSRRFRLPDFKIIGT